MGYKHRNTKGFCDCRPEEYKNSSKFPKPNPVCSKKCFYFIFCNLKINIMTVGERLKKIRLITQRPFHIFLPIQQSGEEFQIMLVLEGADIKQTPRLSFVGSSIINSIEVAEKYIEKEIRVGSIKTR